VLDGLGRVISRHPWWVALIWLVAVIIAMAAAVGGVFGQALFDRLTSGAVSVPGQTLDGTDLLLRTSDSGPSEMLLLDHVDIESAVLKRQIDDARADISRIPQVASVQDPFADGGRLTARSVSYLSDDRRAVLVVVTLKPGPGADVNGAALAEVGRRLDQVAPRVPRSVGFVGGLDEVFQEVNDQVEVDLRTGEGIALPVSLLIMVVVFGGFLAAGLPILGALASIAGAMVTLLGFSYLIDLDASTVNVVTVLGLGLCIDYGLLLVSRYREEMAALPGDRLRRPARRQRELALRRTMAAAGRTVLFSGVTVAVSLTGLMFFRASFLRAIGAAGISIVVVALLVALTLVPALLMLLGARVTRPGLLQRVPAFGRLFRALGDVSREDGAFSRLARLVQRFPLIVLLVVLSALFVMSMPLLRMELVASGTALLPKSAQQRQLFDGINGRFPYAATPTIEVVAQPPVTAAAPDSDPAVAVRALVKQIRALPEVVRADAPRRQGDAARGRITVIPVFVAGSENSPIAQDAVRRIRAMDPGYPTYTTGATSALLDLLADLRARAPVAVLIVVVATFVLLFLMTGSVLIPVKALLMNVVSLGASLGVLVWAFQDGSLESLLDFTSAGGIETFIPPLTLAFGFGLAMDYEVFLLSRIAEYRRAGYSNDESVVLGLQRSGRIITSAALIIVVVFSGFVAGQLLVIKETGLALAVAVAVDATLVRMLLVPATMTLLGEWNWWAPPVLRRLHDRIGFREPPLTPP
jgi:RND superfamily putative drug exporter